jgi:AraC family transcriptional regulator
VQIVPCQLLPGGNLDLSASSFDGRPMLAVVVAGGRGCTLRVDGALAGVWIPLRGRVQLGTGACVYAGEVRVTAAESKSCGVGRGNAVWIAVFATARTWQTAFAGTAGMPVPEPALLAATHRADRALRRCVVELARAPRETLDSRAEGFLERVHGLQAELDELIARCPGRTCAQRRQVFQRLQRVRHHLAANCHLDLDNEALARMASYSPWHFIRAFRTTYGETPHAYLVRMRLERARRLLRASPLAVSEVAAVSGFQNRCAFSRLFRQRFGTTAGAMRQHDAAKCAIAATSAHSPRQWEGFTAF